MLLISSFLKIFGFFLKKANYILTEKIDNTSFHSKLSFHCDILSFLSVSLNT